MFKMTRTFHPVGQGAFYTEKFEFDNGENCNIVYDCGTLKQCGFFRGMLGVIDKAFSSEDCIDGIFISHFDADHVNGFPHLMKHVKHKVRHIFLPHLTPEKILLCLLEKYSQQDIEDEDVKNAEAYIELVSNKNASGILRQLGIGEGRDGFPKIHLILAVSNQDREERRS